MSQYVIEIDDKSVTDQINGIINAVFKREINSKYGTNISVQLSKRWRDIRKSLDAMLKEQEAQAGDEPVEDTSKESGDSNE